MSNQEMPTHRLIDCGATGITLIDQRFACHHQIPLQQLKDKQQVEHLNGRPIESRDITHLANEGMVIQDHMEQLPMIVMKLEQYLIGLEIPCL